MIIFSAFTGLWCYLIASEWNAYLRGKYDISPDTLNKIDSQNKFGKIIDPQSHEINLKMNDLFLNKIRDNGHLGMLRDYRPFPYFQERSSLLEPSSEGDNPSMFMDFNIVGKPVVIDIIGGRGDLGQVLPLEEGLEASFIAAHEFCHYLFTLAPPKKPPFIGKEEAFYRGDIYLSVREIAERKLRAEVVCDLFALNIISFFYGEDVAKNVAIAVADARDNYVRNENDHYHHSSNFIDIRKYTPQPFDTLDIMYNEAIRDCYRINTSHSYFEQKVLLAMEQINGRSSAVHAGSASAPGAKVHK